MKNQIKIAVNLKKNIEITLMGLCTFNLKVGKVSASLQSFGS